jgi:molybdopterin/thiamine biosynthesis adenylyltransferase/rhodanese-related sulfurtransferase
MNPSKENLYKRQVILPEIGINGQQKLSEAKIAIIGCGGLGSTVAVYLAASGVGHIHLVDFDKIDVTNLHRQVFYSLDDVGKSKAKILSDHILKISPFVALTFSEASITKSTIHKELNDSSIIIDCTDSLATKYLLNDFCVISDKVLVYGSLYKHDGYVATFNFKAKGKQTANLRDAFPAIPAKHIPNCAEIGTLNTIVGLIAMMQANEVIKIITGAGHPLINQILIYNSMENTQFNMKIKAGFSKEKIQEIYKNEEYFDAHCEVQENDLLISADDLKKRSADENLQIISVIENIETELPFEVNLKMPSSKFDITKFDLSLKKDIVVVCLKGISSYTVTKIIKKQFPQTKVYSLKNGIENY